MNSVVALAAATALLMTAAALWRQRPPAAGTLALGMLGGVAYFLLMSGPAFEPLRPLAWLAPLAVNRALLAGFGMPARPAWLDAGLALASVALGWAWPPGFNLLALLVFAEVPLRLGLGLADDVVARRRLARQWFLGLGALLAVGTTLAASMGQASLAMPVAAVTTLLLCLAAAGRPWPLEPGARPGPGPLDAHEQQQLTRLRALMNEGQGFRDPTLTLSRLARQLELPEHRLRRLVHLGEGEGHFSAYLNRLRIAAVKAALADPARQADTLLTLATEAGYNSLSVFNRAFKEAEGCTPSAFRAACQARQRDSKPKPPETPAAA